MQNDKAIIAGKAADLNQGIAMRKSASVILAAAPDIQVYRTNDVDGVEF